MTGGILGGELIRRRVGADRAGCERGVRLFWNLGRLVDEGIGVVSLVLYLDIGGLGWLIVALEF